MNSTRSPRFFYPILGIVLSVILAAGCGNSRKEQAMIALAERIHQDALTIDTHCDTPMRMDNEPFDLGERHEPGEENSGKVDFPRMREGGLDAQFFAVFVAQGE